MKMLKLFCNHHWKVIVKSVCLPVIPSKITGIGDDCIRDIILGKTTLILSCVNCGKTERHEVHGAIEQEARNDVL